jgi:hypothetical protein
MQTCGDTAENACNLELNLLGGLGIKVNGVNCDISLKRSKQVLMLIGYIIANRFTYTSLEQFTDIL